MTEIHFIVEEAPEGGYIARALGESIFTEADTIEHLHNQVRDAVHCHFDTGKTQSLIRLHFSREGVLPAMNWSIGQQFSVWRKPKRGENRVGLGSSALALDTTSRPTRFSRLTRRPCQTENCCQ